ncbi:YeeE/YedE family protein [Verticiella sediminum]|uniref:YeeE/YedE family protein n=1 Tax=Verticiella sediminum TaxID=1247510 RepID=A0A556B168_9BURK|nr:YeeE/YedE family protein [Verticiella sediminum]TSH98938.1 YeeE/YedE family protein [Verticiella sediminum]
MRSVARDLLAAGLAAVVAGWAWQLAAQGQAGRGLALSLLLGAAFGLVLQRSRFCFFCVTRDFLERRDARGVLGIVVALVVGTLGYHAVMGAFLPVPAEGRLPAGAHIGPLSPVLAAGAFVFGIGMTLSGSCISAHLYRLGEGASGSVVALLGALVGFGLGFLSWHALYVAAVRDAPVLWLPHAVGYGGSLAIQLAVLGGIAALLWRLHRAPADAGAAAPRTLRALVFGTRWPAALGGALVGAIGVVSYFRSAPLGVTAELGSIARTSADRLGLLPARLEGLDGFAGCATLVKETLLSPNGLFVAGLVLASGASALLAGDFRLARLGPRDALAKFLGGAMMGWGAMVSLGCTVGVLLSGTMAGALSGWVFGAFCLLGVWTGLRARRPDSFAAVATGLG